MSDSSKAIIVLINKNHLVKKKKLFYHYQWACRFTYNLIQIDYFHKLNENNFLSLITK